MTMVAVAERQIRTVVPEESGPSGLSTPLVVLAALLTTFMLAALFMGQNHTWTDSLMARLPFPGPQTSLAADPSLPSQLRLSNVRAWDAMLADQTPTLIAEASVINDALVPVRRIVVAAEARADGRLIASQTVTCGKWVSSRLLRRIGRDELAALREIDASAPLEPGQRMPCQVAFGGIEPGANEVVLRIASAEPSPGHRAPAFDPQE